MFGSLAANPSRSVFRVFRGEILHYSVCQCPLDHKDDDVVAELLNCYPSSPPIVPFIMQKTGEIDACVHRLPERTTYSCTLWICEAGGPSAVPSASLRASYCSGSENFLQ